MPSNWRATAESAQLKTIMVGSVRGPNDTLYGVPKEPPPGFDYDMWLGPAPWAPYSDMRVSVAAWLFISDYGLGCLDGAWGIHDIDIAQWVADADHTGPVEVEGTATFYTDIRDVPHEYTVEHKYANGIRLIHMDMVTARKRAPEFNALPSTGATVIYRDRGLDLRQPRRHRHPSRIAGFGEDRAEPDPGDPQQRSSAQSAGRHPQRAEDHLPDRRRGPRPDGRAAGAHLAESRPQAGVGPGAEQFKNDPEANRWLSRPMRSPWTI